MTRDEEEISEVIPGATDPRVSAIPQVGGGAVKGHEKRVRFRVKMPLPPHGSWEPGANDRSFRWVSAASTLNGCYNVLLLGSSQKHLK